MAIGSDVKQGLNLFQLASAQMSWASERQKVIATNIANADTPGYVAKDVTSFAEMLDSGRLEVQEAKSSWDTSLDGNRVVLEEQQLKANDTESAHRMASRLYRKGFDLIALAVMK